ncbi:type II secretion system F family protein [Serratia symbiotica]|uniref:Pilus assembly protein PilR n=1 Tax=Serratia symbiotica TaxID=138074 RepID=A0A068YY79_9GAMM|nr:type II secretion system F family protein [Serratia symbiotica]QLH61913.1 pilus assembly protein PilR [Serratia symbiotica]CDS56553.1 putative Type IV pilus biogenesis (pilR) [Serratia symbiotica]
MAANPLFYPTRDMSLPERARYRLVRATFSGQYRQPFYETLRFLLENRKALKDALTMIGDVHTDFGTRWHPYHELVQDCVEGLKDNRPGRALQDVLAVWAPVEEAALISAGMETGSIPRALMQADKLIVARRRILTQVIFASVFPTALVILSAGLLSVNNLALVPSMSKISDPERWTGALGMMNGVAQWTGDWGMMAAGATAGIMLLAFWSLPRWRGRLRRVADYLLPWSVYSDLQGAVFLMNIGALLGAGVPELKGLQTLHGFASPWLQERIEAAMDCMSEGNSLGLALRNSGYDFPSREAVNYLSLLDEGDSAADLISNYADRWLEQALSRVARRANVTKLFSLVLIMSFFLLILQMVMQIQEMNTFNVQ